MNAVLRLTERAMKQAKQSSDIVLAVVMAAIIGALIVPLPGWALDIGIAINLAAALALLVAALYAKDALKVATFPTLLLITTLFRLAMNVSSTRLALSEGHAGDIIQAFGEFVVRGDYVVGAVIFAILTLVQFLVVAKGAERVAEVSARFTLDAMPGKQMSIDADLRAGAITQDQARARRRGLERESQLFGSMDGAMKFVKGDVIAGLVITVVNLVGGLIIGCLQGGMTVAEAASTYALISIGDGLVSQIPSLCIAVAAGIVVTRVASEKDDDGLGNDIGAQFFGQWKGLFVVAGLCLALALMPGMPHLTFVAIALALAAVGATLKRVAQRGEEQPAQAQPSSEAQAPPSVDELPPGVVPLLLDLSPDLSHLATSAEAPFVKVELEAVRQRVFAELGVRIPPFRVRAQAPLPPGTWQLSIDEIPVAKASVGAGTGLALASVEELLTLGINAQPVVDPVTSRAAAAVDDAGAATARAAGLEVRATTTTITEHLAQLLRRRANAFLGVAEVQAALSTFEATAAALVREATTKVPLPLLTEVLRRLVQEQVSIRNLRAILDALVSPLAEGDALQLAERCRQALARQLSHQHAPGGALHAYLVDPAVEETLRAAGPQLAIDPVQAQAILEGVRRVLRQGRGILLASADVRRALKRLLEGAFPEVFVLTFAELDTELQVRPAGRLVAAK